VSPTGPRQRNATDEDATRWAELRRQARAGCPDPAVDLMGAIAYRSVFPFDDEQRQWINRANDPKGPYRKTYRELAVAITGNPDDHAKIQSRQYQWNRRAGQ